MEAKNTPQDLYDLYIDQFKDFVDYYRKRDGGWIHADSVNYLREKISVLNFFGYESKIETDYAVYDRNYERILKIIINKEVLYDYASKYSYPNVVKEEYEKDAYTMGYTRCAADVFEIVYNEEANGNLKNAKNYRNYILSILGSIKSDRHIAKLIKENGSIGDVFDNDYSISKSC